MTPSYVANDDGSLTPLPPPAPSGRAPLPHDRMAPAPRPVSPDCEAGKCRPCAGSAMTDDDEIVACQHECHEH
jgi:hypothetical protein